jgi:hypothetical protein
MRLSEVIIIYLAAAAPFGVAFFLRRAGKRSQLGGALAKAAGAALIWPAWLVFISTRKARGAGEADDSRALGDGRTLDEVTIERVKRETVNALRRMEDAFARVRPTSESERHLFFIARECVERYAGLALACEGVRADEAPTAREMELCRIAGRAGDDLLVAGRCFHRRNVTRLLAHRERARTELDDALARVSAKAREALNETDASDEGRALAFALRDVLTGAAGLYSALGENAQPDTHLNAERDPQSDLQSESAGVQACNETAKGGRTCTTQTAHTAFAAPTQSTTTLTRG